MAQTASPFVPVGGGGGGIKINCMVNLHDLPHNIYWLLNISMNQLVRLAKHI